MAVWNMFSEEVSAMRTRLNDRWERLGKVSGCPTAVDSYKQQALVELARRLETERRLVDLEREFEVIHRVRDEARDSNMLGVRRALGLE